jgi:hypothetical protein
MEDLVLKMLPMGGPKKNSIDIVE